MVNGEQIPTVKHVDELLGELRAFTALALRSKASTNRLPLPLQTRLAR